MHTTATVHVHPAVSSPIFVFEVRRLAANGGCTFVPAKPRLIARHVPRTSGPDGGGRAA